MAGPVWKVIRLGSGVGARRVACFHGGFVEDVGDRMVSDTRAWADCGRVPETAEDLAAQGALCVLVQEEGAEARLQGRSGEVGVQVEGGVSWVLQPTRLLPWGPDAIGGKLRPLGWLAALLCPAYCASHRLDR